MSLAAILTRNGSRSRFRIPLFLHYFYSSSSSPKPPLPKPHFHFSFSTSTEVDFLSYPDFPSTTSPPDPNLPPLLHLISRAKSESSTREEALRLMKGCRGIQPTKELVCSALWELRSDWESAVIAFRWGKDCASECEAACNAMVWVLGAAQRFELAWGLVRRMRRKSVLSKTTMVILMGRYAAANDARKAFKTFQAMEIFKIYADSMTFYTLLRALCKNRNVEEAEEFLLLNQNFFPLETEGFNIILDGWCNLIADLVEAKRVWREMSNCCITPDGTSYSHMIRCSSKAGNLCDSLRLYDQMKTRGWVPGLAVYNALIYALTRENCSREAHKIFDKILELRLKPDTETYNSMIYPLCKAHKLEEAWETVDKMMENSIHPTIETYHAFAKAEKLEGTLKLIKRMKDVGCGPNSSTFLIIFEKFFRLNESESALRMWSVMRNYNVNPDSSHYIILVQGLATNGWIPKAMEFNEEMNSKGYPADPKLEKLFEAFVTKNKDHWGRGGKVFMMAPRGKQTR